MCFKLPDFTRVECSPPCEREANLDFGRKTLCGWFASSQDERYN